MSNDKRNNTPNKSRKLIKLSSLKDRALKGVMWSAAERFGNQVMQFFIGLVLARLLMPEDYGLIGMLLVFTSIAQVFVEGGFSSALIRKSEPSEDDYSTVFWFNFSVSIICYCLLFFLAPFIAEFFKEPKLIFLTRVISLNVIINSFGIIQKTILVKNLNFKSQAKINLISILISGLLGIYFAYNGFEVWALVIQNLTRSVLINVIFWFSNKWRPKKTFSISSFRELFKFGSNLMLALLLHSFSEHLYSIIIGKFYNAKSLGFYARANQFQKLPVSSIYGAVGVVCYPVLAKLQNNEQQLKEGYSSMLKLIAFVLFPIMTILGIISEPMIQIILSDKWLPSVPILQALCLVGAIYPLHAINIDILKIKNRADLILKLEVVKQILYISMVIISFRWGIMGLVIGEVIVNFLCYYINSFFSKTLLNYGLLNQLRDLVVIILASFLMFLFLIFLNNYVLNQNLKLITFPILGAVFYLSLAYFFKIRELFVIKTIIFNLKNKRTIFVPKL